MFLGKDPEEAALYPGWEPLYATVYAYLCLNEGDIELDCGISTTPSRILDGDVGIHLCRS